MPELSIVTTADPHPGLMLSLVRDVGRYASGVDGPVQLIIVDDLGWDGAAQLNQLRHPSNLCLELVRTERPQGQVGAVLQGLRLASGRVILVMDPDLHENLADVGRFLASHRAGAELVYGRRIRRHDASHLRVWLSGLFNLAVSLLCGVRLHDINTPMVSLGPEARAAVLAMAGHVESLKLRMFFQFRDRFREVPIEVAATYRHKPSSYAPTLLVSLFFRRLRELLRYRELGGKGRA